MSEPTLRFVYEEPGFLRTYYRGKSGGWYCIQNDGAWGRDNFVLYVCSQDGEPSHDVAMPPDATFDRKVMPPSIEEKTQ